MCLARLLVLLHGCCLYVVTSRAGGSAAPPIRGGPDEDGVAFESKQASRLRLRSLLVPLHGGSGEKGKIHTALVSETAGGRRYSRPSSAVGSGHRGEGCDHPLYPLPSGNNHFHESGSSKRDLGTGNWVQSARGVRITGSAPCPSLAVHIHGRYSPLLNPHGGSMSEGGWH